MDSAGLTDTVAGNTWSIVNGGSISGTQTKFGAGAYNVPPSGRPYLKDVNSNFVVGTSDFTIELCVYINTVGSSYQYFYASLNSNTFIACVLNGKINIYFNGSWHDTGNATVTGAMWHTIAISRHNGTLYTFLDGFIGSNTYSYTGEVTSSNTCCFGSQPLGISYELNGYVDEFRFTKGIARYTTNNFPVASQAFTDGRDDAVDPYMGMIPYLAHYDSSVTQVNAGTCTVAVTGSLAISAPPLNTGIFVSTSQQIVIAYGSSIPVGIGYQQQPLLVQWSDSQNFFNWTPTTTNQAGNFTIPIGSKIVGGMAASNQNLIWTDQDLWAMNYIGPQLVYSFNKIGAGMGLVGPHAAQQLRGSVF
jgi:hypothetical protein